MRTPRFEEDGFVSCGSNSIKPHQTNVVLSNPVLEELKRRQTYVTNENLIFKYVHKKFRVSTIKTEMLDENIIREANLRLRYAGGILLKYINVYILGNLL